MIYLKLRGRIGNQLFMYATARMVQILKGDEEEILIEDSDNLIMEYHNSLKDYDLKGVRYIDNSNECSDERIQRALRVENYFCYVESKIPYNKIYVFDKIFQKLLNHFGIFKLQDGYIPYPKNIDNIVLLDGYFQAEKFFEQISEEMKEIFRIESVLENSNYPNLELIKNRNTVCISIKVQHNVGNPMYDVCNMGYYEKAIKYITERVENPLFMICSDNVQYVKDNLIDTDKYECVEQAKDFPVHISLAAMARCKHFIIGNTSFGWWAQYLGDYSEKIVVAPSRWYGIDMPRDIYQDSWVQIEV